MKKILITGANGFLGKELLKKISEDGHHEVASLTRRKEYMQVNYPEVDHYDMDDFNLNRIPFEEMDVVVHCAFSRGSSGAELSASLEFTVELFKKIQKDIVNISSRSVYGQNPATPWSELTQTQPDQPYGLAKLATEQMLSLKCSQKFKGHATNIRLAGLVGIDFNDRVVNKFINKAIKDGVINIKGGNQNFPYLHVSDAIDGIISMLNIPSKDWRFLYNLGFLRSYNIIEIAEIVKNTSEKLKFREIKINLERTDEKFYAELDSELFYKDTGWKPQRNMEFIVKQIFENRLINFQINNSI